MTTILLLTIVLMLEAGGEPREGKLAVASVVWSRAQGKAANIGKVLLKPKQFSCMNNGIKAAADNAERMALQYGGVPAWMDCVEISGRMMDGTFAPTITANHYYNPSLCSPSWGKALRGKVTIGNHIFGNL